MSETLTLPVLPLRNAVLFPGVSFPISAGGARTLRALPHAARPPAPLIFAVAQRADVERVTPEGLYTIGTIASVSSLQRGPGGMRLLLEGKRRGIAWRGKAFTRWARSRGGAPPRRGRGGFACPPGGRGAESGWRSAKSRTALWI